MSADHKTSATPPATATPQAESHADGVVVPSGMPALLAAVYEGMVRAKLPEPFTWEVMTRSREHGVKVIVHLVVNGMRYGALKIWSVHDLSYVPLVEIVANEVSDMAEDMRAKAGADMRLG